MKQMSLEVTGNPKKLEPPKTNHHSEVSAAQKLTLASPLCLFQTSCPAETAAARPARPRSGVSRRLRPGSAARHQSLPTDVPGKTEQTQTSSIMK